MKRKVVSLLLALALSVSVTACTNSYDASGVSVEESSQESSSQSTESNETEPTKEQGGVIDDQGTQIPSEVKEEAVLFNGSYSDVYYCVDSQGNSASKYDWNAVKQGLTEKGLNFDAASVRAVGDGVIYLCQYEDLSDNWGYRVYAVDADSLEVRMIWQAPQDWWLNDMDYYQGKLYLYIGTNDYVYDELVFAKNENSFQFHMEENPAAKVLKDLKGYNVAAYSPSLGEGFGRCSIARIFDETGFLIGYKDDAYYKITKDGMISKISMMPDQYVYIHGYDENGAIFGDTDYRTGKSVYKAINFSTGSVDTFYGDSDDFTLLTYADGKVYYCVRSSQEFMTGKNSVWQYDVKSGNAKVLYEMNFVPGATDVQPGTQNFQIIDGQVYYVDLIDGQLTWVKRDLGSGNVKNLDLIVGEKSALRYGSIICESAVSYCQFCGIPMEKNYQEEFQLDAKYSNHADEINETLRAGLQWVMDGENVEMSVTDENCQEHLEYPTAWCQTIDSEVTGVQVLSDRYLVINYGGYWYGGGAHGMPNQGQRTFDLQTGKELGLKDFYAGSAEDFKVLVAEKTREDFLSYGAGFSPYYAEDPDEVYEQAYERADPDALQVFFTEDGIYVSYPPYDMGPYASGFIEIFISYEELLGRDHL